MRLLIKLSILIFILIAFNVHADAAEKARQKLALTDLVSDQPGALIQDANLVNSWGVTFNPAAGAFWVSNNGTGKASLFTGDVNGSTFQQAALKVTIPQGLSTGVVFNSTADFVVTNGAQSAPAVFIFVSETGVISGWNPNVPPNTDAKVATTAQDAIYKAVALGSNATGNFIYAADFHNHRIDVFDATFAPVILTGTFLDPAIPKEFSPFNIQNINGKLYVTYALTDAASEDEIAGHHRGFVSVFDTDGNLVKHLIDRGKLNAPWGLALAPADFGSFSNMLLVGNFGNGSIGAYDPDTGAFVGKVKARHAHSIDGLWALTFGNGVSAGDTNTLYFSAGPEDETHGRFGSIRFQ